MNESLEARGRSVHPLLLATALCCAACTSTPIPDTGIDSGRQGEGRDLFVRAAQNVPGGALLGVWVPSSLTVMDGTYDRVGYMVGGYAGVPHAMLSPTSIGRLMGYNGAGRFDTLCTTGETLWAVYGEAGMVYAAGENGLVVRYDPRTRVCTTLVVNTAFPDGVPSFRGIVGTGTSPTEMYFVGGSDSAAGAHAAIHRYDGTTFASMTVSAQAARNKLNAITYESHVGFVIVGDRGTTLRKAPGATEWEYVRPDVLATDDRLLAVSTDTHGPRYWSMAVGSEREPVIIARNNSSLAPWVLRPPAQTGFMGGPLLSVYVQIEYEAYMVGRNGTNVAFTAQYFFVPPPARRLTSDDLYGVHGSIGNVVLAVGGDTSNATPSQHAVILIRADFPRHNTFIVNDTTHEAFGSERAELGGGGPQS